MRCSPRTASCSCRTSERASTCAPASTRHVDDGGRARRASRPPRACRSGAAPMRSAPRPSRTSSIAASRRAASAWSRCAPTSRPALPTRLATALKTRRYRSTTCSPPPFGGTAEELGVEWANIEAADRAGPTGPDWPLLLELVRQATDRVVDDLLQAPRPDAAAGLARRARALRPRRRTVAHRRRCRARRRARDPARGALARRRHRTFHQRSDARSHAATEPAARHARCVAGERPQSRGDALTS